MSLFAELKRRNVFRVAVAYGVIAWLLAQVADLAFDNFGAPEWVAKSVLFVLILGFPLAIFFAWAFELTPEGVKREKDVDRTQSITSQTGRKLDFVIIGVLVVAVGFLLFDRFLAPDPIDTEVTRTQQGLSLAVLPFENRSNRDEDEFFTEGIHDDLLTTIANIGSMKVISRTSVMEYKGTTKKIPEIARELGVANILEGGIQRAGNQVRINVQLIDAATDEHLWAQIYDRELSAENLFEIQTEVSQAIANALHAALSPDEQQRLARVPTENLEAYELFMRGRQEWMARTAESTSNAVEFFQRAIDLDPEYAEAWAGLGDAYRHQVPYGGLPPDEMFAKAELAILKALDLNDQLADAHAAMGALLQQQGEFLLGRPYLERAIELNPNYSSAYNWLGLTYNFDGDYEKSIEIFRKGLEVDPLYIVLQNNVAAAYGFMGQFDEMRKGYERIIDVSNARFGYSGLSTYYMFVEGRFDLSIQQDYLAHLADPDEPTSFTDIAYQYAELGDFDAAEHWVDGAIELQPDNVELQLTRMQTAVYRGEPTEALRYAQQANTASQTALFYPIAVFQLLENDLATGNPLSAVERIEKLTPEGRDSSEFFTKSGFLWMPLALAQAYRASGELERSRQLIDKAIASTNGRSYDGPRGSGPWRSAMLALSGDYERAIDELEMAVDAGWRVDWRFVFDHMTIMEPLRNEPRFHALRMRVADDMAKQLERVKKLESSGKLPDPGRTKRSAAPPI